MKIIDFYGIPGCGKSTISHLMANLLRKQDFIAYEPSYELDHGNHVYIRKIKKIAMSIQWSLLNIMKIIRIYKLVNNHRLPFSELVNEIVNIAVKAYFVDKYKDRGGKYYLIFDEGLTQAVISMRNSNSATIRNELMNLESIIYGGEYAYRVYLNVDIETAMQRLEGRLEKDSRVERVSSMKSKRSMMVKYKKNCKSVNVMNSILIEENKQSADSVAYMLGIILPNGDKYENSTSDK